MNDVMERLAALRPSPAPTTHEVVARDISRGRRALARRRTVRAAGVGVLALAVGGIALTQQPQPADTGLDLVAYEGRQLPGFTVTKVPEGFVLQGADAHVLAVARAGDTSTISDFEDKLVVSVETPLATPRGTRPSGGTVERDGDTVRVRCDNGKTVALQPTPGDDTLDASVCAEYTLPPAGRDTSIDGFDVDGERATLTTNPEGAKFLRYEHGEVTVVVQMWPELGLTDTELREFADGITVTDEARPSFG